MSKQSLTPRQRAALAFPSSNPNASNIHPRHHRANGHRENCLEFDLLSSENAPNQLASWMRDGFFGMWHARVARNPPTPFASLNKSEISYAERYVKRLLETAGQFEIIPPRRLPSRSGPI